MSHVNFYPHFVADQVLTANHLNELFDYLDDQERLTRNHLIGIGIVCGLELTCSNSQIVISKGCGVTSDGYLVIHGGESYTHYHDYKITNDLKTVTPYDQFNAPAALELVSNAKKINTDIALSSGSINRQNYAVVLLLEKKKVDLKNCTTNDCDDKGEKVEMNLRPLLVLKSKLSSFAYFGYETLKMNLPEVPLRRFNVPFQQLTTPSDVLNSFLTLADFSTLQAIEIAYSGAYNAFKIILPDNSDPFSNLRNLLATKINGVKSNSPVHIQYCYDFVDDLIKAYAEFHEKGMDVITECCPDESAFRYHLMLGDSNLSTSAGNSSYRQGFIYSPIFNGQKDKAKEVQMLFQRMKLLVSDFVGNNLIKFNAKGIRITPSQLGSAFLSDRAIPYHYDPNALYKVWNYNLSKRGKSARNLSYHSDDYSAPLEIQTPLKYDIEPFNFFRIEGHIGMQFKPAFAELLKQKKVNNLPIDIIALNMRSDEGNITVKDLNCFFQDLDSQYNLLISELMCKVHHPVCFISKLTYTPIKKTRTDNTLFREKEGEATEEKKLFVHLNDARLRSKEAQPADDTKKVVTSADSLYNMIEDVKVKQEDGSAKVVGKTRTQIVIDAFASGEAIGLIDEVRQRATYVRGSFLKTNCDPVSGSIGFEYLARVKKGVIFSDPGTLPGSNDPDVVLAYFYDLYFYFIDCADKMFAALLPFDLGELDMQKFQQRYDIFQAACWELGNALVFFIAFLDAQATKDDKTPNQITDDIFDAWISLVEAEIQIMAHLCIDDRLQTLKEEYAKRIEKLLQHRIFSQYSADHTGIEHKAGVPKGGTFILVYAKGAITKQNDGSKEIVVEASANRSAKVVDDEKGTGMAREEKTALVIEKGAASAKNDKQRKLLALRDQIKKVKMDEGEVFTKEENDALAEIEKVLGSQAFVGQSFDIANGIVFADFYLPYLCCSDCAPISYVIEESKPDPVQPTISIVPAEFCNQDDKLYPITTTPGGGSLTKVPGVDDVNFTFCPVGLPEGTVTITYTKDGLSAAANCQVFAPKSAEFTVNSSVDALGVFTVTITPAATGGSHEWFLDDAATPFSNKPTPDALIFNLQGANKTIKITHKVKNGPCTSAPVSHDAVLQKTVSNVTDPPITACFSQNIPMAVVSAGAVLTVPETGGLQINPQGFIVFTGPLATPQLVTTVKYTITTPATIVNHTVAVTLFRNFVPGFIPAQKQQPDGSVELTCTATDAAAPGHKWSVDGVIVAGATAAVFKQSFNFSTPEKIVKIRHFVNNGLCQADVEVPVTLQRAIPNVIDPPIIACFSQNIPMAVIPVGGVLTVTDAGGLQINPQGLIMFTGPLATPQLATTVKYIITSPATTPPNITTPSTIVNHTVAVTLFRNFVPTFTPAQKEQADGSIELTCTATDAAAPGHKWSVDGVIVAGASAAVFKQSFNFSTPEKIVKIRHFVNNGACQAEIEIPITLKRTILSDNITAFACAGIKTEQVIDASLVAGDTISIVDFDKTKIKISQSGNTVVVVVNPTAFPTVAIVPAVYKIIKATGQTITRTAEIQVGVVDTQFRITANPLLKAFDMNAIGAKVVLAEWEFVDVSTGVVKFKQSGNPVQIPSAIVDVDKGRINLTVSQQFGTNRDNVCIGRISVDVNPTIFKKITQTPGGIVFPTLA